MISVSGFLSSGTFDTDDTDDVGESADISKDFLAAGLNSTSTEEPLATTFDWGSSVAEKTRITSTSALKK